MPVKLPKLSASLCLAAFLLLDTSRFCSAQTAPTPTASKPLPDAPEPHNDPDAGPALPPKPAPITFLGTPRRFLFDQKAIWTSPLHIKPVDTIWILPLAAVTGTLIGSDQHTMTDLININAND